MSETAAAGIPRTAGTTVVVHRRVVPIVAGLVAAVAVLVAAGTAGLWSGSGLAFGLGIPVSFVIFVVLMSLVRELSRARVPLLAADDDELELRSIPQVRLRWEQVESVRVMADRGWRGAGVGVIPIDLARVLGGPMATSRASAQRAELLRKRHRSQGAPLIVNIRLCSMEPAELTRQLTQLAAGRAAVTD